MFGDFLDKPPGTDVTEDTIFSSKAQVETLVASIYKYGLHTPAPGLDVNFYSRGDGWPFGMDDEGECSASWFWTNAWNDGSSPTPENTTDWRWAVRWTCIRMVYTLLDRITTVPGIDSAFVHQTQGEAYFMLAMEYFQLFEYYGGVPIVRKKFNLTDDMNIRRSTVAETVNFIDSCCDKAIALLPDAYPSNEVGHATKGAALALKSRTLLYAASPTYNTATPYMDLGSNNALVCYGDYDKNRWQMAADAARAVLDWAQSAGVHLIVNKGIDSNYMYVWNTHNNAEQIMAEQIDDGSQSWWYTLACPPTIYGGLGGLSVPLNFVELYEKKDGTPQTWDMNGGNDLMEKYAQLDSRFNQTIAVNHSYWNPDYPDLQIYEGGAHYTGCIGGSWMHKNLLTAYTFANRYIFENQTIFRLAEFYLNYAEALNEAQGPVQQAYDAINAIRKRSGMPDIPSGLTQSQFRERVRHEKAIEFAFEDQRFWDLRRWQTAEQVMAGKFWGIHIYPIPNSTEYRYEPYVFETRVFRLREYRHPFPTDEVAKGYLVQNPGY
jgi:hypothetical protein